MTEEVKKRSNPDYSGSAVKLTNTPEVKGLLDEWVAARKVDYKAEVVYEEARLKLPEMQKARKSHALLDKARKNLEEAVKEFGGYQDIEQGLYALQQVRKSVTLDAKKVKAAIPDWTDKILTEINVEVLKGLLRGKLITQEQVDACATVKESLRFVIDAVS